MVIWGNFGEPVELRNQIKVIRFSSRYLQPSPCLERYTFNGAVSDMEIFSSIIMRVILMKLFNHNPLERNQSSGLEGEAKIQVTASAVRRKQDKIHFESISSFVWLT